ncbi:hypothetical protein KEM56_002054 [Ascosphaera pollenicola]|nr:hypothetical protein KEM56_002054 [Ascosphaera pollenicola]
MEQVYSYAPPPQSQFEKVGLDEDAFKEKTDVTGKLRSFDAFPKTKADYTFSTRRGGQWTVVVMILCSLLAINELKNWYKGSESHHFSVEKGVSRQIQMNIDIVVKMPCDTVRVNMQDIAGDHVIAAALLSREPTNWDVWNKKMNTISHGVHQYQALNSEDPHRAHEREEDQHAKHVVDEISWNYRKTFKKTPKLKHHEAEDSCRIFGSLEGNKIAADIHITPRGHGYFEMGGHLDHSAFNFSHMISEFSFGRWYPSLLNPLDQTIATTEEHSYAYQYFLNIVPTIYTTAGIVDPYTQGVPDWSTMSWRQRANTLFTNQYAVTSQSQAIEQNMQRYRIPGIFFKFNVEPILLIVSAQRGSLLALLVRLVNLSSGVLATGGWLYWLSGWAVEVLGRKRKQAMEGMLGKKSLEEE